MKNWILLQNNVIKQHYQANKKPDMPLIKGTVYEIVHTTQPIYSELQKLQEGWEIQQGKYVQVWTVIDKSAYEIAIQGWHFPEYPYQLRIKVAISTLTDPQVQQLVSMLILWWSAKKDELDHTSDSEFLYFYCDMVMPDHDNILNAMERMVTKETRPHI